MFKILSCATIVACIIYAQTQPLLTPRTGNDRPGITIVLTDVSKTFRDYDQMDTTHLRNICDAFLRRHSEIILAFSTVGNPDHRSLIKCHLHAVPAFNRNQTLSQQATQRTQIKKIEQINRKSVEAFISKCSALLSTPLHDLTDLNGNLNKAKTLLSEPTYADWHKILYVHTDGKHDTGVKNSALKCPGLPPNTQFYTSGHKKSPFCKVNAEFQDPEGFIFFIQQQKF